MQQHSGSYLKFGIGVGIGIGFPLATFDINCDCDFDTELIKPSLRIGRHGMPLH